MMGIIMYKKLKSHFNVEFDYQLKKIKINPVKYVTGIR